MDNVLEDQASVNLVFCESSEHEANRVTRDSLEAMRLQADLTRPFPVLRPSRLGLFGVSAISAIVTCEPLSKLAPTSPYSSHVK